MQFIPNERRALRGDHPRTAARPRCESADDLSISHDDLVQREIITDGDHLPTADGLQPIRWLPARLGTLDIRDRLTVAIGWAPSASARAVLASRLVTATDR